MSKPFPDDSILDPSLSIHFSEATQVLKTPKPTGKSDSDSGGKVQRGPNWGDVDSLLLIQAVRFVAENPVCIAY